MSRILRTLAATTVLGLATFAVPMGPAFATGSFDGTWVIDVPADQITGDDRDPTCPALRLKVRITENQISGNFRRAPPETAHIVENGGRNAASQVAGSVQPDGAITAQWQNFHASGMMTGNNAGLTVQTACGPLQARVWRLDDETMSTASADSTVGSGSSQAGSSTMTDAQRRYNVYFAFDKSRLGDKAQDVVKAAAQATLQGGTGRVELVGKADLSGTDPYNMALSQRRADRVRDSLIAGGVPADRIDTRWVGDREPPVPTAPGVRDAQNRVVEVAFQ